MTLVTTGGLMRWPTLTNAMLATPQVTTEDTLDAAGEYTSYVFRAQEDMTLSHVGWRTGTVVGAPTADTRIETVDTAGIPTGTLWAANTNLVSGTLTSATWTLHALTAAATILKGDFFAVKIVYNSGTSLITQRSVGMRTTSLNLPYKVTNTSGSAVKSFFSGGVPCIAFGSSTTTFYALENSSPATAFTTVTFNNTGGAARALRFQVPFACRCAGLQFWAATSVGNYTASLMDDAGNILSNSDTAIEGARSGINSASSMPVIFDSPVTLSAATWYRAVITPSTATNVQLSFATLPNDNYRSAWPHGLNAHYATFTTVGGWVDTATDQLPIMDILIDQIDNGASGAGGISRARAAGGW